MTADISVRETAIYRFFDDAGRLLYIGITYDIAARFRQHAASKLWWPMVNLSRTTVEWLADRETAEREELSAIGLERPRFNLVVPDETGNRIVLPSTEIDEAGVPVGRTSEELEDLIRKLANGQRSAEFHTPSWGFRSPSEVWERFGEAVGNRGRSAELNAYMEARIAGIEPAALLQALMRWIAADPAGALSALAPYVQKETPPA